MRRRYRLLAIILTFSCLALSSQSKTVAQSTSQLGQAARDARQRFSPLRAQDVQAAKQKLLVAVTNLDEFLATTDAENEKQWKKYLHWDELQAQLKAPTADWKVLEAIAERFYADEAGLELSRFLALREALDRYTNAVTFTSNPDAKQYFEKTLTELAQRLDSYAKKANSEDAIAIGEAVGWLERYGQAKDVVAAVRKHYWRPNLFVQLSEDVLKGAIETEVDEEVPVQEEILGTTILGEAKMKGRLTLDFVPNNKQAAIEIVLLGTTTTTNVGYNRQVTIYSDGETSVNARKRILVDANGISARPAQATCQTVSTINDITANSNLVRNIAWRKAQGMKPQAEEIASERAARKVESKMDEEAVSLVERFDTLFSEKFRNPLIRRGGFPKTLKITTTHDLLHVVGMQTGSEQLAAPSDPPALTAKHDMGVRVHESLVGNLSEAFWGGVTLTDERLQEIIENLSGGNVPEEFAFEEQSEPWSITFANERPIEARFEHGGFQVWIRGTRFTRGEEEIKRSLVISAKYTLDKGPHGVKLTRQGEVEVDFAKGGGKQSVQQVAMRTFMKKKFEQLFKAEIASEGFSLPAHGNTPPAKLRLRQLLCNDGWLALGWQQPSATERMATKIVPEDSPIKIE